MKRKKVYPLIIIGTGPAGYTASIYASRYKIEHLLIGQLQGGTITESHKVCNFPGLPEITGFELGQKMHEHASRYDVNEINQLVKSVSKTDGLFTVSLENGEDYIAQTVLIATGTKRRKLNLDSEKKFLGKGITYCATCDAFFYREKTVAVVGGGDAATTAALYLADIAKKVYIFLPEKELHGETVWIDQTVANPKIEIHYEKVVVEFDGDDRLQKIVVEDVGDTKKRESFDIDGAFIEIGAVPYTSILDELGVKLDDKGYIKVGVDQQTNIAGLYAAGDITNGSSRFAQVITACSEGAVAIYNIHKDCCKQ